MQQATIHPDVTENQSLTRWPTADRFRLLSDIFRVLADDALHLRLRSYPSDKVERLVETVRNVMTAKPDDLDMLREEFRIGS